MSELTNMSQYFRTSPTLKYSVTLCVSSLFGPPVCTVFTCAVRHLAICESLIRSQSVCLSFSALSLLSTTSVFPLCLHSSVVTSISKSVI